MRATRLTDDEGSPQVRARAQAQHGIPSFPPSFTSALRPLQTLSASYHEAHTFLYLLSYGQYAGMSTVRVRELICRPALSALTSSPHPTHPHHLPHQRRPSLPPPPPAPAQLLQRPLLCLPSLLLSCSLCPSPGLCSAFSSSRARTRARPPPAATRPSSAHKAVRSKESREGSTLVGLGGWSGRSRRGVRWRRQRGRQMSVTKRTVRQAVSMIQTALVY